MIRKTTKTLQLNMTESCNLRCTYCYVIRKTNRQMPPKRAIRIISEHLKQQGEREHLNIGFAGAEPLSAFQAIRTVVEHIEDNFDASYTFYFTTNATLLNDEVTSWLDCHQNVQCHVSIDGTRNAHNVNRSGSYDAVLRHVPWLLQRFQRQKIKSSVKMTISPATIGEIANGVQELHALGFQEVHANIPFEDIWDGFDMPQILDVFCDQLACLIEYYRKFSNIAPPQLLNLPIYNILTPREDKFKRWCGAGRAMICFDVDGRAYPCHRFLPLAQEEESPYDGNCSLPVVPLDVVPVNTCRDCVFVEACPSCIAHNWQVHKCVDARTGFHCSFILLQLMASARLQILRLTDKILDSSVEIEEKEKAVIKWKLERARSIYNMLHTLPSELSQWARG